MASSKFLQPLLTRDVSQAFYSGWVSFILIGALIWFFFVTMMVSCIIESWQAKVWRRTPSPLRIQPRRMDNPEPEDPPLYEHDFPPPMTLAAERGTTNLETGEITPVPNSFASLADGITLIDTQSHRTQG